MSEHKVGGPTRETPNSGMPGQGGSHRNSHSRATPEIGIAVTMSSPKKVHNKPFTGPSHNAYAQFDVEGQMEMHEHGHGNGIKVTTSVVQDVDMDDSILGMPAMIVQGA